MKNWFYLFFFMILVTGCKNSDPAPKEDPSFTFNADNFFAPTKVSFTNQLADASTYFWDFGDGSTSTEQNPTHVFIIGKLFAITLKATNSAGVSVVVTKDITILPPPTKFKINSVKLNAISFTDSTGAGWDVSDGPDIYFQISTIKTGRVNNVQYSQLPITFNQKPVFPILISDLNDTLDYSFYDYDLIPPDQFMAGLSLAVKDFMPTAASIKHGGGYPSHIDLSRGDNPIYFSLSVEWAP